MTTQPLTPEQVRERLEALREAATEFLRCSQEIDRSAARGPMEEYETAWRELEELLDLPKFLDSLPNTEVQGVSELRNNDGWPAEVRLHKPPKSDRVRIAPHGPAPGFEANWENETRVYVPASLPAPTGVSEGVRERLMDVDGPVLLTLREEIGNEVMSRGWGDEEGEPLHANGADVEAAGNAISDAVRDALSTVLTSHDLSPNDKALLTRLAGTEVSE